MTIPRSSRRRFIATGLGALAASHWLPQASVPKTLPLVSRTGSALGTHVTIQVRHDDQFFANEAISKAFAAIEKVESIMSLYRPTSQLTQLNERGELSHASEDLLSLLKLGQIISQKSRGAFDLTVQPLWALYQKHHRAGTHPTEAELNGVRKRVSWKNIHLTGKNIRLAVPKTQLTLNGIAQGYATDRARDELDQAGIEHALIDCGELSPLGRRSSDRPWQVGIQHPRESDSFAALSKLKERSLATSGDYASHFSADFRQHHIVDPRTGRSPSELASASVVAQSATLADALSTTLLVMGAQEGFRLIEQFDDVDALLITKTGRQLTSPGFPVAS